MVGKCPGHKPLHPHHMKVRLRGPSELEHLVTQQSFVHSPAISHLQNSISTLKTKVTEHLGAKSFILHVYFELFYL